MEAYVWLALIILGIILEAVTANLVSIWFVIGCVFALIVSFFGAQVWVQILVAVVISVITLFLTRPLAKKITEKNTVKTNADRLIGRIGIVTDDITDDSGKGRVEVSGQSWAAVSRDGSMIKKGQKVTVESISGVKFIVVPINDEE